MTDVVVVGAGVAGLTAARTMALAGADVTVVEARSRAGGRTWSELLANGHIAERGGEYFDSSMEDVHDLARELGLRMTTQGFNPSVRPTADPDGPSLSELEAAAAELSGYWESLGQVADDVSVSDVVAAAPLPDECRQVISARLSSGRAVDISRVSARWVDGGHELPLVSQEHNTRIAEGNQALSQRLADEVGWQNVRLRWPAASLEGKDGDYRLISMLGDVVEATMVVLALPASILKEIQIEGLDSRTRAAITKIGFGQASKLHLTVTGDCAPGIKQEVSTPFSTWATASVNGPGASFVTGFASTHQTREKLSLDLGPHRFRPLLENQWPGVGFGPDALFTHWGADPWTRGAYSFRPVGWTSEDEAFVAAPSGGVFFAGEHTADRHQGSISGAVRSGKRAAGEVLSR